MIRCRYGRVTGPGI